MTTKRELGGAPQIKVRQNRAEVDIPAAIARSRRVIDECRVEVLSHTDALGELDKRRDHYRALVGSDANPFDDDALNRHVDGLVVEQRKLEDARTHAMDRMQHHQRIIAELEVRAREEADGGPIVLA